MENDYGPARHALESLAELRIGSHVRGDHLDRDRVSRLDVEPAPCEEAGDPGQDAGPVLDEDREDVCAPRAQPDGRVELLK